MEKKEIQKMIKEIESSERATPFARNFAKGCRNYLKFYPSLSEKQISILKEVHKPLLKELTENI